MMTAILLIAVKMALAIITVSILLLVFVIEPFVVTGNSMYPTYRDGEIIFVLKCGIELQRGDVICFKDKEGRVVVKRVSTVNSQDKLLYVLGDNENFSHDSRHFGWLPRKSVIGKVIRARDKVRLP